MIMRSFTVGARPTDEAQNIVELACAKRLIRGVERTV